ncbi:MAG: hypothetical protein KAX49_12915 [Halanaerobiales bacterium]|nr:hypothetical protein [Halanaerobiales bacterium]
MNDKETMEQSQFIVDFILDEIAPIKTDINNIKITLSSIAKFLEDINKKTYGSR